MTEENKTNLPDLDVVEVPKFDVTPYVGKSSTVEEIKLEAGKYGQYLRLTSAKLGEDEEGKAIHANMLFSLKTVNGKSVINQNGELAKFMKNKKVTNYKDLIGKQINILSEADDNGNDWLVFA